MALPTIPGTVRATFRGLCPSGRQWANVLHCRLTSLGTPTSSDIIALDAILARIYTGATFAGGTPALVFCTSGVTLIDATYYPLNGIGIPQVIPHAVAGTGAGNSFPPEVAMCVTVRTGFRGRSQRGRVFLPPMAVANGTVGGNWSPATMTAIIAQITGAMTALAGPGWEFGVASYITQPTKNGLPFGPPVAPHFTTATSVTIDAKPDVQRRRK